MAAELVIDPLDRQLLDDWQRDFPVVPRPFARIAAAIGLNEAEVIDRLERMRRSGRITRVGGTCAPNSVSASTLAAIATPPERIEEVAAIIGDESGVNHSYLREHEINLWFVVTGPDRAHVDAALARIAAKSGLRVLDMRLVRPFNVDLGFSLLGDRPAVPPARMVRAEAMTPGDRRILQALTSGMPLAPRPYAEIAGRLGRTEGDIIARIAALREAGVIARLGVIVRHRALGWRANAMVVWDIAAERIDAAGPRLAAHPGVTLCYERTPVPGVWPYRLYSMIHARSRTEALDVLSEATGLPELAGVPHRALFSLQCFKQTGALITLEQGTAA
jgi:DNA-binding Lrp family transcriptional regulator